MFITLKNAFEKEIENQSSQLKGIRGDYDKKLRSFEEQLRTSSQTINELQNTMRERQKIKPEKKKYEMKK